MGTPRPLASVDQMRNVQSSAKRGGETAEKATSARATQRRSTEVGTTLVKTGANVAFDCAVLLLFASGCDTGVVFLGDVAQHVLFAQQLG
jgi:hypothetical protein